MLHRSKAWEQPIMADEAKIEAEAPKTDAPVSAPVTEAPKAAPVADAAPVVKAAEAPKAAPVAKAAEAPKPAVAAKAAAAPKPVPAAAKAAKPAKATRAAKPVKARKVRRKAAPKQAARVAKVAAPVAVVAAVAKKVLKRSKPIKRAKPIQRISIIEKEGTRIMKNEANKIADRVQAAFGDVNERARAQIERNTRIAEELTELGRGNVEALVASTKVAAKGVETIGQEVAEYSRKSFEEASAALKAFAELKSPTDFFRLQSEFARTQFDSLVSETSRFSETVIKLAGDVAAPLTSRYSVAAEKVKAAVAF
jgi:phasin family protein